MNYHKSGPSVAYSKDKPDKPLEEQPGQSQSYLLPHSPSSPAPFNDLSASSSSRIFQPANVAKSPSTDLRGKPHLSRKVEADANISQSDTNLELNPLKQTQTKNPDTQPATPGVPNEKNGQQTSPCTDHTSATKHKDTLWFATKEEEHHKASHGFRRKVNQTMRGPERQRQSWTSDLEGSPAYQKTQGQEDADLKCQRTAEGDASDALLKRRRWSSFVSPEQRRSSRDTHFVVHTDGDTKKSVVLPNESSVDLESGGTIPDISILLHWFIMVSLAAYVMSKMPLASYATGVSVGVACGFILGLLLACVLAARCSSSTGKSGCIQPRSRDPLDGKPTDAENLEGWLNQTASYDPQTFHHSAAQPVFASLAGSQLRLSYPQASDGPTPEITRLPSITYWLANCQVSLAPPGLARKRIWNKKYPICIILAEGEAGEENLAEGQEGEGSKRNPAPPEQNIPPFILYLFARTGREKEWWFENFRSASRIGAARWENAAVSPFPHSDTPLGGDTGEESTGEPPNLPEPTRARKRLDYTAYMKHLVGSESCSPAQDSNVDDRGSPTTQEKVYSEAPRAELRSDCGVGRDPAEGQTAWLNSLAGRIFLSFLQDQYWTDVVANKIQQKLLKFKLKYFMSELALVDLDMGTCLPQVLSISKPTLDPRGLWLDLEIMYTGCFQMTMQTKLNLSKLGKDDQDEAQSVSEAQRERMSKLADSDEESSSAASSDDEDVLTEARGCEGDQRAAGVADMNSAGRTSAKILKFMDKIAKSRYFQKARENEYIRKKIAEVTNMPLMLTVEVLELSGTLAVNIPPPPSDRIWYSFRAPPKLDLRVRPMLGEREVTFSQVTEWIERKLKAEFQAIRTRAESASSPPVPHGGLRAVDKNAHWLL